MWNRMLLLFKRKADRFSRIWREVSGLLLLCLAMILALAAYSYHPSDYAAGQQGVWEIRNLAGPVGANLAHFVLGLFGFVGLSWPVFIGLWGLLTITGFSPTPNLRRTVALLILAVWIAAIVEIQCAHTGVVEPYFGYGGAIGQGVATPLFNSFGYGGSLIILVTLSVITLVVTGHFTASKTKDHLVASKYHGYRAARWSWERLLRFKQTEEQRLAQLKNGLAPEGKSDAIPPPPGSAIKFSKPQLVKSGQNQPPPLPLHHELQIYDQSQSKGKPALDLFQSSEPAEVRPDEYHQTIADRLTEQLQEFKVQGKVLSVNEGPVVTTYEFEPSAGQKVSKITSLSEDLARLLEAKSLRILAPIPGKRTIGFEVPNARARKIGFRDLVEHASFRNKSLELPIAMGMDTSGEPVIADLANMPHILVAGSTGSGKSVFMNSLIASLICRHSPKTLRFVMIDPKMVELAAFNKLPHMACPVVTDPQVDAQRKLQALVAEMERRYHLMGSLGTRNIQSFNEIIKTEKKTDHPKFRGRWQPLPYVVLIIDELADLMMTLGKDAETPIARLAQKARAAGIHMVIATQRPSVEVVTGLIKANFPTRVGFRVLSGIDSRTILDQMGAETLLGRGDMLYLSQHGMSRLHGAYLSDKEVQNLVKSYKA
ncbi:MAG: DNA translocase FtsK 4TM domain-containing protein [Oligoflexus sp.]